MNVPVKAALLSACLFPGSGQLYLKRYGRGLVMILLGLVDIAALVGLAVKGALAEIARYEAAGGVPDPEALARLAVQGPADGLLYPLLWAGFFCLWGVAVIDAYRLGKAGRIGG